MKRINSFVRRKFDKEHVEQLLEWRWVYNVKSHFNGDAQRKHDWM